MKITRRKLRQLILKEMRDVYDVSSEEVIGVTEPRHDVGSPERKLLQMIGVADGFSQFGNTTEEIADKLGVYKDEEPEVFGLIDFLNTPGAGLASVGGWVPTPDEAAPPSQTTRFDREGPIGKKLRNIYWKMGEIPPPSGSEAWKREWEKLERQLGEEAP